MKETVVAVTVIPVAAIARATMPATIRARRLEVVTSDKIELRRLVARLSEIDSAILQYQYSVGADSFANLLLTLVAIASRTAPQLSASRELEQFRSTFVPLLEERREINRRILRITNPGVTLSQGPYVEPARSGPSDSNYQVYRSGEAVTGSVVVPVSPPPCHQEERTHREYRMTLEPNGFDEAGTPLYRNVYHPFPITELVTICP